MVVQRTAVDVVGPEEEPNENSPEALQLLNPPPVPDAPALEPSKPLTEEDAQRNEDSLSIQEASPSRVGQEAAFDQTSQPAQGTENAVP